MDLLRSMDPVLCDDEFVFCTAPEPSAADAIGTFREREGVTLICRRAEAERCGLAFAYPCRMITLNVHSNLEAVGFLGAVAGELSRHGIAVNVVSAHYHDHLFIAVKDAEPALASLRKMQAAATDIIEK
jgi:hypothetical protein